jgi:hypothetical protein
MSCEDGVEELYIDLEKNNRKFVSEDLFHVGGALYDASKIKIAFMIFIAYILMNTDIFAESILSKISKKNYDMNSDKITGRGIIISAMMLSLFYIIIDLLASSNII